MFIITKNLTISHFVIYSLLFFCVHHSSYAQKLVREVSIYGHNGHVIETNNFLGGENQLKKPISSYKALSFHLGFNLNKDDVWKSIYKNASFGIGAQITSFHPHKDLGVPYSIYGFIQSDVINYRKLTLRFNGELGLAQNWNQRSSNNLLNDAISLSRTVHIDLGLDLQYRLTPKHIIGASISAAHFSNAAIKRPNQGINTITPKIFYSFLINEQTKSENKGNSAHKPIKRNNFGLNLTAGYHNYNAKSINDSLRYPFKGVNVRVFGLNANYGRSLNQIFKIGIGADLIWDEGLTLSTKIVDSMLVNIHKEVSNNFEGSIYPLLEIRFYKISLSIQQGIYLYRQSNNYNLPRTYQRIGIIYHINRSLNAGAFLRAYNFKSANFLECSFGISF